MPDLLSNAMLQLLADKSAVPDPKQLLAVLDEHPTFAVAAALLLSRCPDAIDPDERKRLQAQALLNCPDRLAIADLADLNGNDWANFYPPAPEPKQKTTDAVIDKFISTYGNPSPQEDAVLERLIFNPVAPDYFQGLDEPYDPEAPLALPPELAPAQEEAEPAPAPEPQPEQAPEEEPSIAGMEVDNGEEQAEDSLLMESLAKIFIKRRRYERALEIISNLSLKYPEKSVYFADQMRFLQKLIVNQQCWQQAGHENPASRGED